MKEVKKLNTSECISVVLQTIHNSPGLSRTEILSSMKLTPPSSPNQVDTALRTLQNKGDIYSRVDDNSSRGKRRLLWYPLR